MKKIIDIVNFIGIGNVLTITTFLIGLFIAFYFYFKNFYRLIYISETIRNNSINEDNPRKSRILFYNNGRKTLTPKEIEKLQIKFSNKIIDIRALKTHEGLQFNENENKIDIDFKYLDSNEILLLEIIHHGNLLSVDGRISETGKILNTEPKNWLIINFIFMLLSFIMIFYNIFTYLNTNVYIFGFNFSIVIFTYLIIRYIHRLLFIPDSIAYKYLGTTDKLKNKFVKEF